MVGLADDFRSHVSRRPASILRVVGLDLPRNAQVSHPQVALIVKHQVFGLEVAVDDALAVQVLQGEHEAGEVKTRLILFKFAAGSQVVSEWGEGYLRSPRLQ